MFRQALVFAKKHPKWMVALGATAGVAVLNKDRLHSLATEHNVLPYKHGSGFLRDSVLPPSSVPTKTTQQRKWDDNWDKRDPISLLNIDKYVEANEEERERMLAEATPTATRNIFLIRHGQYELDSKLKQLTPLGREQAALLGQRLAGSEYKAKYNKCYISTMQRAKETAQIMLEHLPHIAESDERKESNLLEEGAPYPPEPPISSWKPEAFKFHRDSARIEAAFRKYIHRATPKQKEDSFELIVCHANVIRYFVCRALQFPPEGWLRMSLANASITWIQIRPNGQVSLRALGDFGHLMPNKVTFT